MGEPHRYDFWLQPLHDDLLDQIFSVIEEIAALDDEIKQSGGAVELKVKRKNKLNSHSKELNQEIDGACSGGHIRFISDYHAFIDLRVKNDLGAKRKKDIWRELVGDFYPKGPLSKELVEEIIPSTAIPSLLSEGAWLLHLGIKLKTPYTSRSESDFHVSNNPIVRDHLTGRPMVKPTTWKGHLRFSARMTGVSEASIRRIFGASADDENSQAGRLRFFPTFFDNAAQREVVTPLKRETRTPARGPIDIETIPPGTDGEFWLLYQPNPRGAGWSERQPIEDLAVTGRALKAMFLEYGFSAKKTAGWGRVDDNLSEGRLWTCGAGWPRFDGDTGTGRPPFTPPNDDFLPLIDAAGEPIAGLRKPDGSWLSNKEFNQLAVRPCSLNAYKQFRSWYRQHGAGWKRRQMGETTAPESMVREHPIGSITGLHDLGARFMDAIRQGATDD